MRLVKVLSLQAPLVFVLLTGALLVATGTLRLGGAPGAAPSPVEAHGPGDGHDHGAEVADAPAAHGPDDGHDHGAEVAVAPAAHGPDDGHDHGEPGAPEAGHETHEGHDGHGDEGGAAAEVLEERMRAACEHGVATVECAPCRTELGVVKVEKDLAKSLLRTARVTEEAAGSSLDLTGIVRLDSARTVDVPAVAPGRVLEVAVDLGQDVEAGATLAVLSSGDLAEAKAAWLVAFTASEIAAKEQERQGEVMRALDGLVAWLHAETDRAVAGDESPSLPAGLVGERKSALLAAAAKLKQARLSHERERTLEERGVSARAEHEAADQELRTAEAECAALLEEVQLSRQLEQLRADNVARQARVALLAAEQRLRVFGLTDEAIAGLRRAEPGEDFAKLPVLAPRAGTVTALETSPGHCAEAGEKLFTVSDFTSVWVWCDLFERDVAPVATSLAEHGSLRAVVKVAAFPDRDFEGVLDILSGEIDEHTRTLRARVRVPNPARLLRPGMFAKVSVEIPADGNVRLVPRGSVLSDEGAEFVFLHLRDELWVRQPVIVRRDRGGFLEIDGDLPAEAVVVSGGAFMLKSDVLRGKMGAG